MEIIKSKENGEVRIRLIGRLDTVASQEIAGEMESLKKDADRVIVLDCSELEYISSSGLRLFLTLRKTAEGKGGAVVIRGISDSIRSVFMMTGFLNLFAIE